MGKVFNIPFSAHFLEQLIKKVLKLSNNLKNPDSNLIILPHKRIQTAFTQKLSTINNKLLFPKITTFSSIDENLLDFDNYCNNIYTAKINLIKKHIFKQDQLYILILSIIKSIKKNNHYKFDTKFLDSINYSKILKTLDEYYYYQYHQKKLISSTKIEKLIFIIIEALEKFLIQHNLILKSQSLNFATKEIVKNWNYQNNASIFIILPQTEVSYIKYFIDNLAKYKNAYIFIRGYDKTNTTHLYQNHILDFLKRTKITTQSIENLTNLKHIDYLIPSILLKNTNKEISLDNLNIIRGKNQNEEAKLIALIIREKLELSSETIVVQTKSEKLASLIEEYLKLWNINVENLINKHSKSSIANFLLLIALYLNTEKNNYSLLLDILKSMHCKAIETNLVRNFELNFLRRYLYREKIQDYFINISDSEKVTYDVLLKIEKKFLKAKKLIKNTTLTICEYFQIHLDLFHFLNNYSYNSDFTNLINNIEKKLTIFKNKININFDEYFIIIKKLINSNVINNNYKITKSVTILQTFENRNVQYKTLIFAGLNEKAFIDLSFDNNFFNKNFRMLNNLKPIDSELQFLQYDFISSLYNKDVVFSYSEITSHSNDQVCRWLEKLRSTRNINEKSIYYTNKYLNVFKNINKYFHKNHEDLSYYCPKIEQRPSKISVTGIEKLITNPYVYYIKYILNLNYLEKIAKHAEKKEFGIIIHKLIHDILLMKIDNEKEFMNLFTKNFINQIKHQGIPYKITKFWNIRLQNIAKSIYKNFIINNHCSLSFSEIFGAINIKFQSKYVKLICIADKIDILKEQHEAKIIDFKSGLIPSSNDVLKGISPQLAIEKYILMNNGFKDIHENISSVNLEYFDISGKYNNTIIYNVKSYLDETENGIKKLLEEFLCNKTDFFITKNISLNNKNKQFFHIMRYSNN